MKKIFNSILFLLFVISSVFAQKTANIPAFLGDWKDAQGTNFAKVYTTPEGIFQMNLTTDITSKKAPLAILKGEQVGDNAAIFECDGWKAKIDNGKMVVSKENEKLEMEHFTRSSPTLNAAPPKDAIILFDGSNLDAWTKVLEKDWLVGGTPVDNWKIVDGGALEVGPHAAGAYESIITKQKFGDIKLHLEFRLLGPATNGGIYFMSRYEINIKDAYSQVGGTPIGFGNVSDPKDLYPEVNVAFPPGVWQTFDIDFRAPRFNKAGTQKTEDARITMVHNGTTIYKDVAIKAVKGSTAKLGEAGVGPIYLQEHGVAYQFRNIWIVDKTLKGTSKFNTGSAQSETTKTGGNKSGGNKGGGKSAGSKTENVSASKAAEIAVVETAPVKKKGGSSKKKTDAGYEEELNPFYAATDLNIIADKSGKPAPSAGFVHPGILVNGLQLEELKKRVAEGTEPQKSAFEMAKSSEQGALDYAPQPFDTVSCGPYSTPNIGCKDEQKDCAAAYTHALLWTITGDENYAKKAIEIMNAWSYTLVGGHNYANGPVQSAWCGSVWPRAAEIIRYTYNGWPDNDIAQFQNMLRTQYLPYIMHGDCENGNKELAMSEALINIGVFNDDRAIFDLGIKMWRLRTPAYIYMKSDGPTPIEPPGCGPAFWSNKGKMPELVDGLLQETARDAHHPGMAFASMANAAETAYIQGVDLYKEEAKRLMAALEFIAQYLSPNNVPVPENLKFSLLKTWEIAYNHFQNRMGNTLPMMTKVIPTNRPTGVDHHMVWETLTHGEIGKIGFNK